MSRLTKIKTAVVGLGVGEQHARAYVLSPLCELRSLCDLDAKKAQEVQKRLGIGKVVSRFESILNDSEIDLISIASYDHLHAAQVLSGLSAGKHLFVEKPLCQTREELLQIQNHWKENGKKQLASNLVLRGAPIYQWLKKAIDVGELGKIYAFDGDYLYGRLHKITEGWRKDVPNYSVLEGGGIHLIDLMLMLTGEKPKLVTAVGNRICTRGTAFRYDDFAAATFEFDSGLIGRISAHFGCIHRHQHVVRVFGTKGTFIYDDRGARLHQTCQPDEPAKTLSYPTLPAHKGVLIPAFVESILKEENSSLNVEREFQLICVCIAAEEALLSQKSIQVEYL